MIDHGARRQNSGVAGVQELQNKEIPVFWFQEILREA